MIDGDDVRRFIEDNKEDLKEMSEITLSFDEEVGFPLMMKDDNIVIDYDNRAEGISIGLTEEIPIPDRDKYVGTIHTHPRLSNPLEFSGADIYESLKRDDKIMCIVGTEENDGDDWESVVNCKILDSNSDIFNDLKKRTEYYRHIKRRLMGMKGKLEGKRELIEQLRDDVEDSLMLVKHEAEDKIIDDMIKMRLGKYE